jgi:predicted short-subunit dehydrogenase-like oxidoreductase (DUF2520 family)
LPSISKISFIGSGNVATHLARAFFDVGIKIRQIYSLSCINAEQLSKQIDAEYICDMDEFDTDVDLIIFAVKDEVIRELSAQIIRKSPEVKMVHTSGSVGLDVFENALHAGIFYPLQSFSKTKEIDISKVPFLITSENTRFRNELIAFAKLISRNVYEYSDEQRRHLHIAAVFVNNFSNHLFAIAQDYCEKHHLDYQLLMPLIHETIHKIDTISPKDAQTGPAKRNDSEIIQKHLQLLKSEDEHLFRIYSLLTDSILKMYGIPATKEMHTPAH